MLKLFAVIALAALSNPSRADDEPAQQAGAGPGPGINLTLTPLGEITFSTDLKNSSGSFSVYRGGLKLGVSGAVDEQLRLNLSVSTEASSYHFRNATGIIAGTSKPFNDMNLARISPSAVYAIDNEWAVVVGGLVEFAGEGSADVGDSATGGGFASARYAFSKDFSLGFGVLAVSRLEDSALVVPIVSLEWQITPKVSLASKELGGVLTAKLSDEWSFFMQAGYETREYRLAEESLQSKGVLRDRRVPVSAGVRYAPARWLECSLRGGATVWQEFKLDDMDGNQVSKVRSEPAPFIGLALEFRF